MKKPILIFLALCSTIAMRAQGTEFTVYPNGYIYSEASMAQLQHIVDSLNLRFKSCAMDRTYRSMPHMRGRLFHLEGKQVDVVLQDIKGGVPLEELMKKYAGVAPGPEHLCTFFSYEDYDQEPHTSVIPITFGSGMYESITGEGRPLDGPGPHKGKWLFTRYTYDKDFLDAFYLTDEVQFIDLPERYGRLVQYVDCLIDTTQQIHRPEAVRSGRRFKEQDTHKVKVLMEMVDEAVTAEPPSFDDYQEDEAGYNKAYGTYAEERRQQLDSLAREERFKAALDAAGREALEKHSSNPQLEGLMERYGNKADALELRRGRIVVGGCSMDTAPRTHALAIATLAAETVNWDIFLRAHLDILNDNFQRSSDGSYAWAGRQTYIRELEALDINVPDLMLGTMLYVSNSSKGHYSASANRTGRALSEAQGHEVVAERVLTMIADPELDLYNRAVLYYLFLNYNGKLEDETVRKRNKERLAQAMASVPKELRQTEE